MSNFKNKTMKGKVIKNCKFLPLQGFSAIAIFPFIFVDTKSFKWSVGKYRRYLMNHERIHLRQQLEMLILFFYIWYVVEYLIKLVHYKDRKLAYENLSFEREAYSNEEDINYLFNRDRYSWIKYL